jgi:NodT family efflux transporter outer membrane factor (OMF) lipoprotein
LRRSAEGSSANAQAAAANLAAARLSARAALATAYFELRAQDELRRLLDSTVAADQQALTITENRYRAGVAGKADVVTARTQLLSSQAQQENAGIQRAQLEHAIAVLVGKAPAVFSLEPAALRSDVPTIPAGLPSTLLQRRPDVAAAERKMAAANAQVGVATAAYFPNLTLSGSVGYSGTSFANIATVANRVWSFGPELAASLFDGGLRRAQTAGARAAYDASVATYRQTVLTALQQVEDTLATLRTLERQAQVEGELVKSAELAQQLVLNQYKAGTVPYSSVITAQTTAFASEQSSLGVLLNRLTASVALIAATGGGWSDQAP